MKPLEFVCVFQGTIGQTCFMNHEYAAIEPIFVRLNGKLLNTMRLKNPHIESLVNDHVPPTDNRHLSPLDNLLIA